MSKLFQQNADKSNVK